ncbi:hypothetical protein MMC10_004522 [Thelotrema lepadinum]|nr:hypothetical protein [Thelotrema lepadinum]
MTQYRKNGWAINFGFLRPGSRRRASSKVSPLSSPRANDDRSSSEDILQTERISTNQGSDSANNDLPSHTEAQLAETDSQAANHPAQSTGAPGPTDGTESDSQPPTRNLLATEFDRNSTPVTDGLLHIAARQGESSDGDNSKTQLLPPIQQSEGSFFSSASPGMSYDDPSTGPELSSTSSERTLSWRSRTAKTSDHPNGIPRLTHLTSKSEAHMVSIASKRSTHRVATAICYISFSELETLLQIRKHEVKKGDVIAVSRVAGITAAKKTSDIIPLSHPGLAIESVNVLIEPVGAKKQSTSLDTQKILKDEIEDRRFGRNFDAMFNRQMTRGIGVHGGMRLACTVECTGKTGVEMEALAGVYAAALTVYDMCKSVDKGLRIDGLIVIRKTGGKTGFKMPMVWE